MPDDRHRDPAAREREVERDRDDRAAPPRRRSAPPPARAPRPSSACARTTPERGEHAHGVPVGERELQPLVVEPRLGRERGRAAGASAARRSWSTAIASATQRSSAASRRRGRARAARRTPASAGTGARGWTRRARAPASPTSRRRAWSRPRTARARRPSRRAQDSTRRTGSRIGSHARRAAGTGRPPRAPSSPRSSRRQGTPGPRSPLPAPPDASLFPASRRIYEPTFTPPRGYIGHAVDRFVLHRPIGPTEGQACSTDRQWIDREDFRADGIEVGMPLSIETSQRLA